MSTRDERRRILDEVREMLGEAKVAHSMSDEESEHALLAIQLDDQQQRLDEMAEDDPVGFAMFGDDDGWLDRRLRWPTPTPRTSRQQ